MLKNYKKFLLIFLTSYFLLLTLAPFQAQAVDYLPLVPCGLNPPKDTNGNLLPKPWPLADSYYEPCTRCDAFKLTKNIIDFVLIGVVPPVAAVLFILGGLMIVLAGARQEWISIGRNIFWNTFIGLVIIFSAWLVVNTFIQSFGPDQIKDSWFRFTCQDSVITGPGGVSLPPGGNCADPQSLADYFDTALPNNFPQTRGVNAPELDALISCVNSRLRNVIDQNQLYTYERNNPFCNLTRGSAACGGGSCAHSVNSCHYGGPDGTEGSLAVDFNAAPGVSEDLLFRELRNLRDNGNPCDFGFINFEGDHTHVSTPSCVGDTGGD